MFWVSAGAFIAAVVVGWPLAIYLDRRDHER